MKRMWKLGNSVRSVVDGRVLSISHTAWWAQCMISVLQVYTEKHSNGVERGIETTVSAERVQRLGDRAASAGLQEYHWQLSPDRLHVPNVSRVTCFLNRRAQAWRPDAKHVDTGSHGTPWHLRAMRGWHRSDLRQSAGLREAQILFIFGDLSRIRRANGTSDFS